MITLYAACRSCSAASNTNFYCILLHLITLYVSVQFPALRMSEKVFITPAHRLTVPPCYTHYKTAHSCSFLLQKIMTKILKFKRHQNTVRSSWPAPDSKWKLISAERGDCLRPRTGSGESGAEEVATTAPGGGVDTPGWPWQRPCRSHRGPLATCVNSDDFSGRPCELTLLGETQEVGSEPWQCRGGLSVSYLLWRGGGFVHDCVCSPTHAAANTPGLSVSSVFMKQILCPS